MCIQCPEHCTKQETVTSINELWTIFRAAYEQYQLEILNDEKLYDRYINDFISYHLPIFSNVEEVVRNHFRNIFCLYELLSTRKDLVEKYFTRTVFEEEDFNEMLYSFNHLDCKVTKSKILASFNKAQIQLITQFANESNLFVNRVDEKTIDDFFKCNLNNGLIVTNMASILPLLYELSRQKMIPYNWVSLLANNKLLVPKKTMKSSTRIAISSRLTELKDSVVDFPGKAYINLVQQLKEMI